ncbi:MAG: hypothetical protein IKO63_01085, partial [Paludibacteraceae bacterium]|nr:hypothetical protein [Paludibacteraceae bacterium]
MNKHILIILLLITCTLRTYAGDSITISAADLQSLVERIERLERRDSISPQIGIQQKAKTEQSVASDSAKTAAENQKSKAERRGRFTIGGYGEITAKHCFYSNNYL